MFLVNFFTQSNTSDYSRLISACRDRDLPAIQSLINNRVSFPRKDRALTTAITELCRGNIKPLETKEIEILTLLINNNIDLEMLDQSGQTPLSVAKSLKTSKGRILTNLFLKALAPNSRTA